VPIITVTLKIIFKLELDIKLHVFDKELVLFKMLLLNN